MKTYKVELESKSPIAFGRFYTNDVPKLDRESSSDFETRTWMHRAHVNDNNEVFIPALGVKNALLQAAKYSGKTIPGAGKKTYSAKFASGVLVIDNVVIGKKADLKPLWLHVPSDGMRGGSKRVMKAFPILESWKGEVSVIVLDEQYLTEEIVKEFMTEAGNFVGLGALRVQNNGILGRFSVGAVTLVEQAEAAAAGARKK
jgi:hypothetical protein